MTWETINLGTNANVGDGDTLLAAFSKVSNNLEYLKTSTISSFLTIGTGVSILDSTADSTLSLRSLSPGNNMSIVNNNGTIVISADTSLQLDSSPILGGNLNTNGHEINHSINGIYSDVKINDVIITSINNTATILTDNNLTIQSTNGLINLNSNIIARNISALSVIASTNGLHTGNVVGNVTGNLTGSTTGIHVGPMTGNVTGTVSDVTNHSISELNDVSEAIPNVNDILSWDGTKYQPITIMSLSTIVKSFTTIERDMLTPVTGEIIFNITDNKFQGYTTDSWVDFN
jgi:hypothetical protein